MPRITRPGRSHRSENCPFPKGTRIRATANFGRHNYQPNETYTVARIDPNDQTLIAKDSSGEEGNWIRWADCSRHEDIGWDWLKTKLPAEALDLLSAFSGLEGLTLREEIRSHLILKIPDLKNRIFEALEAQEHLQTASSSKGNAEAHADTDDFAFAT